MQWSIKISSSYTASQQLELYDLYIETPFKKSFRNLKRKGGQDRWQSHNMNLWALGFSEDMSDQTKINQAIKYIMNKAECTSRFESNLEKSHPNLN